MENSNNPSAEGMDMIEIIKPETLVNVPMSSGFYKKIQDALGFIISGKTVDELNDAHQQISTDNVTEEWIRMYETLLVLAKEFEEVARKEGFIIKVTKEEAAEMMKDQL